MEAEGGVGIHVDPPVTVFLDTVGFRVLVIGWYDGYGRKFCKGIGSHQRIATGKHAVAIELPPLRMNFIFWC